ncbi:MAG: SCO family protein, partial [Spongiibacteraceae bacterium]|nr:SCO family protein [Spongiibacteraceae bacterium]
MGLISSEATAHQRRGILATVIGVVIFVCVVVGGFVYTMTAPRAMSDAELKANGAYLFEAARDIGDFRLLNANGQPFVPADLQGHWSLVFFGFTHCPDICPTTLALLKQLYDQLEPGLRRSTQVVLVTVDPARDTPDKLLPYVQYFDPDFVAVTGEFLDIHRFATALNIPFRKV